MKRKKEHILLIDDEIDVLEPLKELVQDEGYEVSTAANGEIALELFNTNKPDLVITDINLPNVSGIDLLKQIKEIDATVPVIMLSAHNYSIDSLRLRADDYIPKPPDFDYLFYSIKKLLKIKHDTIELDRLKREEIERETLLSAMSCLVHELNTPLNGIMGSLQFLKEGELSKEEISDFLDVSLSATRKAIGFIHSFTSYQSLGMESLQKTEFSFKDCLISTINSFEEELKKYRDNIVIHNSISLEGKMTLYADELELKNVIKELLTNAARRTKGGTITVTGKYTNGMIEFSVSDNGDGIETQYFDKLFIPGQTAHNPLHHSSIGDNPFEYGKSGFGFGLSYVKKVIALHQGNIDFESEFGKGTKFTVFLPIEKNEHE